MVKKNFKTVDEYISCHPEAMQVILRRVRSAIRKAIPKAEEVISYQIPAYKLHGETILFFAGWKEHYSLYPAGARMVTAFKDELTSYKISKGTIRFPLTEAVPTKLIERIAGFRAQEASGSEKAKAAKRS